MLAWALSTIWCAGSRWRSPLSQARVRPGQGATDTTAWVLLGLASPQPSTQMQPGFRNGTSMAPQMAFHGAMLARASSASFLIPQPYTHLYVLRVHLAVDTHLS